MIAEIARGSVVWAVLDPVAGREQAGHRPTLVVAADGYLAVVTTLLIVLPVTTSERGWPNHVRLRGPTGLPTDSWAMTEQPRTISPGRVTGVCGAADRRTMAEVDVYLRDFLSL